MRKVDLEGLLKRLTVDTLGELLREITFVDEGLLGCYNTFKVRSDAKEWSCQKIRKFIKERYNYIDEEDCTKDNPKGYTFKEGNLTIDVFWKWDGDGTLYFRVRDDNKIIIEIINDDCKKIYGWRKFLKM